MIFDSGRAKTDGLHAYLLTSLVRELQTLCVGQARSEGPAKERIRTVNRSATAASYEWDTSFLIISMISLKWSSLRTVWTIGDFCKTLTAC